MFQHQKDRAWHDIVTLDESWFYFTTGHERISLPKRTETPEKSRITVQSRKMIAAIVWNPTEFYRIVALPKGMKYNADYCISLIYLIHSASGKEARSGARTEDCIFTRTMLAFTLRRRSLNSWQEMV
jgi:hypothetical protein